MKTFVSIATFCLAACLLVPAASAQTAPPARRIQVVAPAESSYLGINALDISADRAKALKLKEDRGVEVTSVDPDSAAGKAGLKEGDVILEFNGQRVEGWEQLRRLVSETPAHREVKIGIWRNGAEQTLSATMGSRRGPAISQTMVLPNGGYEAPYKFETPMPSMPPSIEIPQFRTFSQNRTIGIFGEPLGQEDQLAEFFGVRSGVLIRSVVKGSAAEKAGIKAGDVLTKIDEKTVASPSEITSALRAAGSKRTFTVTVVRNKKETALTLTLENVTSIRGGLWHIDGWDVLPFPAYQRIIQGAEEGVPEIIR